LRESANSGGLRTGLSALLENPTETPRGSIPWIYGSTISFFLAGGVFYLWLAHTLPSEELGSVVVLSAIALIMSTGAALGLGAGFQHFLSFYKSRSELSILRALVRSSFLIATLLSLAAATVLVALSSPLSTLFFHSERLALTIKFLGLYSGLATAAAILQSVLVGLQRFVAFSIVSMVGSVSTYGMPVVLLHFWPSVQTIVFGWVVGAAITVILAALIVIRYVRQSALQPTDSRRSSSGKMLYRSILLYSVPVLASSLVGTAASYVDRLVLSSLVDLSTVAIYNYAILVTAGSLFVVGPFATVLVPRISTFFGRDEPDAIRRVSQTSATLIVLVYVPFALGLAAIGPFLLRFLVGSAFVAASFPLAALLGITAASIPYTILISLASGIRRTGSLLHASALALVANIGFSVVLVPRIGMIGAAFGNSSMYWVAFLVLYFELRGTDLVRFDSRSITRIWTASATMFVAVVVPLTLLGYDPTFVPLFIAVGTVVFLASLRLTRAVPDDAADALIRFLPRWAGVVRPTICWVAACERCSHDEQWSRLVPSVDALLK
jgi:O-antigen/teichoic acid export membrane protein